MSPSTLIGRLDEVAREHAGRVAVIDDQTQVGFAELVARAERVASGLTRRGLAKQRIAMLVAQGSRWIESFFGIALSGGIAVPLSPLHPPPEQRWFVEASRAAAVIVSAEHADSDLSPNQLWLEELLRETDAARDPASDSDPALILYTSGTTGRPKGALITHGNLASLARLLASAWKWSPDDVLLHSLPLHHLHGLGIALFPSLLAGGTTRMLERFDAARLWEEAARATVLMGVPTMHKKLIDALDAAEPDTRARWREHASHLRLVTSGSAALPVSIGARWRELTGSYPLERFGMTEIGVGASNPISGPRVPGSCGPVLPGMELRIVDEGGQDVKPGDAGEIWIRGPSVFVGYDQNDRATAEAFSDGWFKSGDTATWLDRGYVKILGRTSVDILKSGGYKLSALEIEEVLREHAGVADVAVVGVEDETWGEIAVAAVLPAPGHTFDEAALRDWAKQRIAAYKVPKRIVRLDDFPRNPVGKVKKPELKARLVSLLAPSG